MTKVLVLYYSSWGHIESMAQSVAEGARSAGAEADLRRVPELLSDDVTQAMHFKTQQDAAIADPASLVDYDAIIVGSPTRFGRLPAQMALFWDRSGSLWLQGKLVGKVGAAFVSTGTQHGGGESTLSSILNNLLATA